jgi:hypothetical protein
VQRLSRDVRPPLDLRTSSNGICSSLLAGDIGMAGTALGGLGGAVQSYYKPFGLPTPPDSNRVISAWKRSRPVRAPAGLLNVRSFASFSNYGKMNNVQIVPKKPNVLTETHCNFWVVRPLHN